MTSFGRIIWGKGHAVCYYLRTRPDVVWLWLLIAAGSLYFLDLPIVIHDTDLWYHLNSGRYIFGNRTLPSDSFFSFLDPIRAWTDYFWLFQVIVYKVYVFGGYHGLILLRAVVYCGSLLTVLWIFSITGRTRDSLMYFSIVFVLYLLFLQGRFVNIRPHIFSYLLILLLIGIIESRGKIRLAIPVLALLWVNLHGIEYPVMCLIIGAYAIEHIYDILRRKVAWSSEEAVFWLAALPSFISPLFFIPAGWGLLEVPFVSTRFASLYISELQSLNVADFFTIQCVSGMPSFQTVLNLIAALICLVFIVSLANRKLKLSHFILLCGGVFLLMKGERFRYEFALLSLPLLAHYVPSIELKTDDPSKRILRASVLTTLLLFSLSFFIRNIEARPKYPVSQLHLPYGVVSFLNKGGYKGHVLNHPNFGGFLQWELYPRQKILMDMEVPFLFSDEDFFRASNAFADPTVLQKLIYAYRPPFIIAPIAADRFNSLIERIGGYTLVFFDDVATLYVDRNIYPSIAERYEIKALDPYALPLKDVEGLIRTNYQDRLSRELMILLSIYPECMMTNQIAAELSFSKGDYSAMISYADVIVNNFPDLPTGFRLRARALARKGYLDAAMIDFEHAISQTKETERNGLYRAMSLVALEQRKYKKAYVLAMKGTNIFAPDANYIEIYQVGSTALLCGKKEEGKRILKMGYEKVPNDDMEWKQNYTKLLAEK